MVLQHYEPVPGYARGRRPPPKADHDEQKATALDDSITLEGGPFEGAILWAL